MLGDKGGSERSADELLLGVVIGIGIGAGITPVTMLPGLLCSHGTGVAGTGIGEGADTPAVTVRVT